MADKADRRELVPDQNARAYQQVLHDVFGVPFALYDAATGAKVAGTGSSHGCSLRCDLDPATVIQLATAGQAVVMPWESNAFRVSLVLHSANTPVLVAVGVIPGFAESPRARTAEHARLQAWARDFSERLRLRDQLALRTKTDEDQRAQFNGAWKTILTLGECMQRVRFNRHELRDRRRILEAALQLVNAEALLWVSNRPAHVPLIVGESPLSLEDIGSLERDLSCNPAAQGPDPFVCNEVRSTSWGAFYPKLDSLLSFRITGPAVSAWLIALNKRGKPSSRAAGAEPRPAPFRHSDAALLSPFVGMLEMHARAAGKFDELRSLLVGLARSLTAAIDAKDAYTAGHSERVARLAIEIGRELHLPDEQLSDTYLAGLLHDVGKIGIREAVLCKPAPLTAEEFNHMKQHVTIGYHILQDLKPIRHLLPGVLYHHERIDGKGYPEGLAGEKIPILARLLAVADAFDAMNSDRPYRRAFTQAQVFEELKRGAGTQWDLPIVAAALRCKDRLVAITQRGLGDSLRHAVDAALRVGDSSILSPSDVASAMGNPVC